MAQQNRTHVTGSMPPHPLTPTKLTREEFGRRLDALRINRGWTQSDLGRHSGIQRGSISEYVKGRAFPTSVNLKRLASALNVEPAELLPNTLINAIELDEPSFEMKVSSGDPRTAFIRINRLVSVTTAAKIALLLEEDRATDAAADAG